MLAMHKLEANHNALGIKGGLYVGQFDKRGRLLHSESLVSVDSEADGQLLLKIAKTFADILRKRLSASQWREMQRRNAEEYGAYQDSVCASHDFCDANVYMDQALTECGVVVFDEDNGNQMSESMCALWGSAWGLAKCEYLSKGKSRN